MPLTPSHSDQSSTNISPVGRPTKSSQHYQQKIRSQARTIATLKNKLNNLPSNSDPIPIENVPERCQRFFTLCNDLFKNAKRQNINGNTNGNRLSESSIELIVSCFITSPASLRMLNALSGDIFPHASTMRNYMKKIPVTAGLIEHSFRLLEQFCENDKYACVGIAQIDCVAMKPSVFLRRNKDDIVGTVEVGNLSQQLATFLSKQNGQASKEIFVLQWQSSSGRYTIPLAACFLHSTTAEIQKIIFVESLMKSIDSGMKIRGLCYDSARANLLMTEMLGATPEKPYIDKVYRVHW